MFGFESAKHIRHNMGRLASIVVMASLALPTALHAGIWDEGDIENGQALFNANCASCHLVSNEVWPRRDWPALQNGGAPVRRFWSSGFKILKRLQRRVTPM